MKSCACLVPLAIVAWAILAWIVYGAISLICVVLAAYAVGAVSMWRG